MIKTVIFDYNGTLINDTERMATIFSNTLKRTGLGTITLEEFKDKFELPMEKLAKNFNIPDDKYEKAKENFVHELKNYKGSATLFPDTQEILKYLKDKNIKIIILTSYMQDKLEKELKQYNIDKYIDEYICDGQKIEAINNYISENKLKPKEILCVGDVALDIEAGKQAGTITTGFTGGAISRERLEKAKPDYLIDNLLEIKNILNKINK